MGRGIALISPLIVVPTAIAIYGAETYGLWAALTSITAMALFADLGLGNGLLTRLSQALASDDIRLAKRLIASAYGLSGLISLILLTGIMLWSSFGHASSIIPVPSSMTVAQSDLIVVAALSAFALNIPITLIHRIQYADQRIGYSNIWLASASVAAALTFVLCARLGLSAQATMTITVLVLPAVGALNTVTYFVWKGRALWPGRTRPMAQTTASLFRLGLMFFVLSAVTAVALNIDPLLVSHTLGLTDAAEYAVSWRVATILGVLVTVATAPFWPTAAEALARGDVRWVRRTMFRISLYSSGIVASVGFLLIVGVDVINRLWLGDLEVGVSRSVLAWLVLWSVVIAILSPVFMVQNAVGLVWPQLIGWSLFLVISVSVKLLVVQTHGIAGVAAVTFFTYGLIVSPFAVLGMRLAIRAASRKAQA